MSKPGFNPTPAQQAAIRTVGTSVLVSAGAGSGKTAVLAHRCAYLVADLRCPIERLLVVTFTEAAAAEMRNRIHLTLGERLAAQPRDTWLQRQLAMLDTASISTIHSFCRQVLNRCYAQAGLDPRTPLLDEHEAMLLRQDAAREALDESLRDHETERRERLLAFLAAYGRGGNDVVIGHMLRVAAFLDSIPDPEAWLDRAAARYAGASGDTALKEWCGLWAEMLRQDVSRQIPLVERLLGQVTAFASVPPVAESLLDFLREYLGALRRWQDELSGDGDARVLERIAREIAELSPPALSVRLSKKTSTPTEQAALAAAKEAVCQVRDDLLKGSLQKDYGGFTVERAAAGLAVVAPHVDTFLGLVRRLRSGYRRAKREQGVLDFADLERMTLDLLRDETNGIAARLRRQYEHILVDEFQDINPIQAEVMRRISREADPAQTGNLYAVGDVKQSIYAFRLAEPGLFLERQRTFRPLRNAAGPQGADRGDPLNPTAGVLIHLRENWRSRPAVLEALNAVFERLMAADLGGIDYDEQVRLRPARPDTRPSPDDGPVPIELHLLADPAYEGSAASEDVDEGGPESEETDPGRESAVDWLRIEREAYVIARRVHRLVAAEGIPCRDIVVLLRSMQPRAGHLVRMLQDLGIPAFAETTGGFFEALEIIDLLALLKTLDNAQQDIPLAAVLRSPLIGTPLSDDELAAIRTAAGRSRFDGPFHQAVRAYAAEGEEPGLRARLADVLKRLEQWRRLIRLRPLADVLWRIYEETGYLAYVSGLRGGRQRRANLLELHEHARRFGAFRRQGLHRFLRFLDELSKSQRDLDPGTVACPSEGAVRVMSIHKSKGLEFPVVVVGELGKEFNLQGTRDQLLSDRHLGVAMKAVDVPRRIIYPTLPHQVLARRAAAEARAEELRILYVALTRAKERLVLVGTGRWPDPAEGSTPPGPLPAFVRHRAGSHLEWVVAAVQAQPPESVRVFTDDEIESARPHDPAVLFDVCRYTAGAMAGWTIDPPPQADDRRRRQHLAALEPLPDAVSRAQDPIGQRVRRRLTTSYAFANLTSIPAVVAASELKRRWDAPPPDEDPVSPWLGAAAGRDRGHRFGSRHSFRDPVFTAAAAPDPTARGTWTHALLQHLDLTRPCSREDILRQREALVAAGALRAEEAAAINADDIAWFCETPLGRTLRRPSTRVLREWPFLLSVPPERYQPGVVAADDGDHVLVRGIIDCLFDAGEGWELLDYKTDAVPGEELAERCAWYRGQLAIYAAAVEATWQTPVHRRWLVFLTAREIVAV